MRLSRCGGRYDPGRGAGLALLVAQVVAVPLVAQGAAPPSGHVRMVRMLEELSEKELVRSSYLGDREADELTARLEALGPEGPIAERWKILFQLGVAELRLGRERQSIAHLEEAYGLLEELPDEVPGDWRRQLVFRLGVAYTRLAETENCTHGEAPESCILPFRKAALHHDKEGSTRAVELFSEVMADSPPGSTIHLASRWLANIAHMTLGTHPDGLPAQQLIPPRAFTSEEPFPRFENVAPLRGIDTFSLSGGAVAEDFDGDDDLDLLVSTWHPGGQIRLFLNRGDGRFDDATERAGLIGVTGGLNMVQADYDNDGDEDVLVLRGAWLGVDGGHPNSLLRNDRQPDGVRFVDVTFEVGLGEVHYPTQTASWADYDNDGDLDLYIGNEASEGMPAPCQLFRNGGSDPEVGVRFVDVAGLAGVENRDFAKGVMWGDLDGDRWPDLYVSNLGGDNRLYKNLGKGRFSDVAQRLGVEGPRSSFPIWMWDYDNDGDLDLFVSAYAANVGHIAAAYLGVAPEEIGVELARLYRNEGRGGLRDVALEAGIAGPTAPMGSNFGDLDGDGWLDAYLGTGYPSYQSLMPNVLYRNLEGRRFADVTFAAGVGHLQKGHGVAFADFDGDGDLDLFEQMGGAFLGDGFRDVLYENPGFGHHFLVVHLVGVRSNRSGIGARLRVVLEEGESERTIYRWVTSGGSFGANPLRQHIGLGGAEAVSLLEVYWPTSDTTQVFRDLPLDSRLRIVEGRDELEPIGPAATTASP